MSVHTCLLALIVCCLRLTAGSEEIITQEICHLEQVNADCPDDHVIFVHDALYGRMERSRCRKSDFGYKGCKADVIKELDRRCSGRRSCNFPVTDLHGKQYPGGCPDELTSYLFIRYSCIEVTSCDERVCRTSDVLPLSRPRGVLASHVTVTSGCGSESCPWLLEAQPGQKINLTLVDLSPRETTDSVVCHRYASISEDARAPKDITSCPSDYQRERQVYLSDSSSVRVLFIKPAAHDADMHFFIKYQVIHCPDQLPPPNANVFRSGETLTVSCKESSREWHLVCQGTAWVGQIGECNDTSALQTGGRNSSIKGSPFGMLIVIGLGVALGVLVGIMLLVVVFLFMRRHRRRDLLRRQRNLLADTSPVRDEMGNKLYPRARMVQPGQGGCARYFPDHSFTATIQLKRPLPLPMDERHDFPLLTTSSERAVPDDPDIGGKCPGQTNVDTGRHVYETTRPNVPVPPWTHQLHRHSSDSVVKTVLDPYESTDPENNRTN